MWCVCVCVVCVVCGVCVCEFVSPSTQNNTHPSLSSFQNSTSVTHALYLTAQGGVRLGVGTGNGENSTGLHPMTSVRSMNDIECLSDVHKRGYLEKKHL